MGNFVDPTLPGLSVAERQAIYADINRVLVALHEVGYAAAGLSTFGRPGNYFARQIDRWKRRSSRRDGNHQSDKLRRIVVGTSPMWNGRTCGGCQRPTQHVASGDGFGRRQWGLKVLHLVGRLWASKVSAEFGQSIVVDNKPGASHVVGTEFVAKAPADGYTLLQCSSNMAINAVTLDSLRPAALRAQTSQGGHHRPMPRDQRAYLNFRRDVRNAARQGCAREPTVKDR